MSSQTFKAELLRSLRDDYDITPDTVAKGLAQVIKGETVVEKQDGEGKVKSRTVTTSPKDILQGAMIYDALRGGDLGLAPKQMRGITGSSAGEVVHKRLGVDSRIIANSSDDSPRETVEVVEEEDLVSNTMRFLSEADD